MTTASILRTLQTLIVTLLLAFAMAACAHRNTPPATTDDEARHRAALTVLTVYNRTTVSLTIAFRATTPPIQEVVIGTVRAGGRETVAPIPAGEPIILIARAPDGGELTLTARSYPIDSDWTWDIPAATVFRKQDTNGK